MKRLLIFLSVVLTLNLSSPSNTYAVNPIIALEGLNLGVNILKEVGDKVKDGLGGKKKERAKKTEFICIDHYEKTSENLVIGKFEISNSNYDLCINKSVYPILYKDLLVHLSDNKISIELINKILKKHDHYYYNNFKYAKADNVSDKAKKFTKKIQDCKKIDYPKSLLDPCIKSGGGRPVDDWITFSKSYGFGVWSYSVVGSKWSYSQYWGKNSLKSAIKLSLDDCNLEKKNWTEASLCVPFYIKNRGEPARETTDQEKINLMVDYYGKEKTIKFFKNNRISNWSKVKYESLKANSLFDNNEFDENYKVVKQNAPKKRNWREEFELVQTKGINTNSESKKKQKAEKEIKFDNLKQSDFLFNAFVYDNFGTLSKIHQTSTYNHQEVILLLRNEKCKFGTDLNKSIENLNHESSFDYKCEYKVNNNVIRVRIQDRVSISIAPKNLTVRSNNSLGIKTLEIIRPNEILSLAKNFKVSTLINSISGDSMDLTIDEIKNPKLINKKITKIENIELNKIINKIERLMPGDYYVFAHSTNGEKFWGSTKAKNNTTQIGKATSSSGYNCNLISKQLTRSAPFKGSFELNCPNDKIKGSWTQDSAYSPGVGQAFTKRGEVITAFFSYNQSTIKDFASKYFNSQNTKITKKAEPTLEEFKPSNELQATNKAPKLIIKENLTFNTTTYEIIGKFEDEHDNIFIEVDGKIVEAKNGRFKIPRFAVTDEKIKLVAIDKWGEKSEPKIINIKIEIEETIVSDIFEPLNPKNIKSRSDNNKVALIIGIENYSETPQASYANLDAKYFYEYSKKAFGVKPSNINLLIDEEATFVKTSKALTKWLNSKVKKNRSELIIFFAGHGLASTDGKELYLLPQDSDPDLLSRTALSRTELFKEIMALSPKSVTMFLDTCFSGISRDEKTLLASARPIRIVADENEDVPGNFTIFSASQLDQISSGLKEAEHGIFSYYLMKGLEGKADSNQDKKITNGELLAYMNENVSQKAAELGREQNPSLAGDPDKILISY